jgi:CrcB protein
VIAPVLVGAGGAAGAVCRHLVSERVETATRDTLAVNTVGSLLLGVVLAAPVADSATLPLATGFCGAFTTFSSFAFETVRLAEDGFRRTAARNAAVTLALALGAVAVGAWLGGAL